MTNPFVSTYPDPDSGGGPCGYCDEPVSGKPVWFRVMDESGELGDPVCYHVRCRDAHWREHWHDSYDAMTLGEAIAWLHSNNFACACMGAPNGAPWGTPCHCRLVNNQAERLRRGAHIAVKQILEYRDERRESA